MVNRMRNFHEILWICGSFICCLVKRGRDHIFVFLVSTMSIFSKLCSAGWTKNHSDNEVGDVEFWLKMRGTADFNCAGNGGFLSPLMTPKLRDAHLPSLDVMLSHMTALPTVFLILKCFRSSLCRFLKLMCFMKL